LNTGFLKKLKQKLQIGNTRSIHLNSYPGRLAARLDLFELHNIRQNLPEDFLKKLLNNSSFHLNSNLELSSNNSTFLRISQQPITAIKESLLQNTKILL
jgi:hypothetical protein